MNKYEVAVVASANLTDEERAAVIEQIKGYIEKYQGTVTEVEEWGKRRLAYEIRKEVEGYYYFIQTEAEPAMAVELEKDLRIMQETVLRYLIVSADEK
ncbi:MAG: 30S ribosomal protein S6 [Firmicutes bacterium]|nr:30S ribosomal protein S6 [Bacillota bacterium]